MFASLFGEAAPLKYLFMSFSCNNGIAGGGSGIEGTLPVVLLAAKGSLAAGSVAVGLAPLLLGCLLERVTGISIGYGLAILCAL